MATRGRGTALPGKEKSGTSPLHPIACHLRSPNSSKTSSPVRKQADSTISNKNVPNYLKPTVSSLSDKSIHNKPTLSRGRSFDKPPVAALQKTKSSLNPKEKILRSSSSFSGKISSTSQKPLLDKLSRAPLMTKDATGKRGTGQYSRSTTMKKTTGPTTKKQDGSTNQTDMHIPRNDQDGCNDSTPKAPIITNAPLAAEDVIPQSETVSEIERDVIINNSQVAAIVAGEDNSAIEDQEELNENANNAEIEDLKVTESSIHTENQEIIKMEEELQEKLLVEETGTHSHKEPQEINNEPSELHLKENPIEVLDENQKEKEENEGINQGKGTAIEEQGEAVQESKITAASSKPQRQVVRGKKESAVSNNAIEETASKLREQRKNRVKALAGAFESVMQ